MVVQMNMAGMSQYLKHKDPTHADDTFLRLNNLRNEGILCDLTILVEGREYKAHKTVMAACSDYFLNAICGEKSAGSVSFGEQGYVTIDLEHVTVRGFAPLLEYAYTANLQVNALDVIDVLSAASLMQMFKVANACSEFMRTNILWTQSLPRLSKLPAISHSIFNGEKQPSNVSSAPSALPPTISDIFKGSQTISSGSTSGPPLGHPPLLIPIHPMAYDVGFQQLAARMTGSQSFFSPASGNTQQALASSGIANSLSSSSSRHSSESPKLQWHTASSKIAESPQNSDESVSMKMKEKCGSPGTNTNENCEDKTCGNNMVSGGETEENESSANGCDNSNDFTKPTSPTESDFSEPVEDSWQALQKLYSIRMTESQSMKQQVQKSPCDRNNHMKESCSTNAEETAIDEKLMNQNGSSPYSHMSSNRTHNSNSNNNNNNLKKIKAIDHLSDVMSKMTQMKSADLRSPKSCPTSASYKSNLSSSLIQQDQIMRVQQNGIDSAKMVNLPIMPPNGQYMSVRRRTLQSTVPKPHQCQICGSRFTRFHNLKQHIKLHSGIKPYECDECGKRFTRNYTLRLHKMKHVGIRNFRCGTCDATFSSLGEFRAHLRITMHSHVSASTMDCGSPSAGNSEPEDLTPPLNQTKSTNSTPTSYSGYDMAMMNYQRNILNDQPTLLHSTLGNHMIIRDGGGLEEASSGGAGSPHFSERSISPQDLTTKSNRRRSPCFNKKKNPNYSFQNDTHATEDKQYPDNTLLDTNERTSQEDGINSSNVETTSPGNFPVDSPTFEGNGMEISDATEPDHNLDHEIDQDYTSDQNDGGKTSNKTDRPISLVVNASA